MTHLPAPAVTGAEDSSSAQAATPPAFPPSISTAHGYYSFVPYTTGNTAGGPPGAQPAVAQPPVSQPAAPVAPALVPNPHIVTGIPPGLASLLRWTGPWSANVIYSAAPTGPLAAVDEPIPAPEWYCITRGCFVGVIDQFAQAHYAIRGISNTAHKAYSTQAIAINAFNKVVAWGGIEVV
ncbi:hypothetical protein B0H17DRAFT_1201573 [Mycena rosella]|uniref:Uncharacterized protein n=1 Tax=Mycena rosella TaxID=1033263 RepID=A0AAD7GH74_MYCRO|nr:hypothetical protein B0H17DRAFT_1201573 [Mycena rosella]